MSNEKSFREKWKSESKKSSTQEKNMSLADIIRESEG